ncbi:MAG: hypothetical protein ABIX28_03020 [Vicinamibacterales bacterium]
MNESPALMGVYSAGWFRQFVFDASFVPLVKASRAAGERVFRRGLEGAIEEALFHPAGHDRRRLIAFSEHELNTVSSALNPEIAARVASNFLNARAFAAAWISRDRPDLRKAIGPSTLEDDAALCGFEWPDQYNLKPTDVIKRLRSSVAVLRRTKRPPAPRTTELWTRLLGYNRQDCLATKHVVCHAALPARCPGCSRPGATRRGSGSRGNPPGPAP